jgi:hypothetical protein
MGCAPHIDGGRRSRGMGWNCGGPWTTIDWAAIQLIEARSRDDSGGGAVVGWWVEA